MSQATDINSGKEIVAALSAEVMQVVEWASQLSQEKFFESIDNKWSTGEQIEHLRKSSSPLAKALAKPKFILRIVVGKANRPSRSYEEVANKYKLKLGVQSIPRNRFYPDIDEKMSMKIVLDRYLATSEKLVKVMAKWHESELDHYILPHPLLGKLTVREMLFFTIYHTQHHFKSIKSLYLK